METVNLIFKYSQKEYVKAFRQHLLLSKRVYRSDYIIIHLIIAALGWLLFHNPDDWLYRMLFILCLIWGLIIYLGYFSVPVRNFKAEPKFRNEYQLTFSKNGIKFITEGINSNLSWSIYTDMIESADFYYLIQTRQMYTIIPKRAFISEEQRKLFAEIVQVGLSSTNQEQHIDSNVHIG